MQGEDGGGGALGGRGRGYGSWEGEGAQPAVCEIPVNVQEGPNPPDRYSIPALFQTECP